MSKSPKLKSKGKDKKMRSSTNEKRLKALKNSLKIIPLPSFDPPPPAAARSTINPATRRVRISDPNPKPSNPSPRSKQTIAPAKSPNRKSFPNSQTRASPVLVKGKGKGGAGELGGKKVVGTDRQLFTGILRVADKSGKGVPKKVEKSKKAEKKVVEVQEEEEDEEKEENESDSGSESESEDEEVVQEVIKGRKKNSAVSIIPAREEDVFQAEEESFQDSDEENADEDSSSSDDSDRVFRKSVVRLPAPLKQKPDRATKMIRRLRRSSLHSLGQATSISLEESYNTSVQRSRELFVDLLGVQLSEVLLQSLSSLESQSETSSHRLQNEQEKFVKSAKSSKERSSKLLKQLTDLTDRVKVSRESAASDIANLREELNESLENARKKFEASCAALSKESLEAGTKRKKRKKSA